MNTILLNAMFVGSYGVDNIDGEIINFYLDDGGQQNYYVPAYGYLPNGIGAEVEAILMVYKQDGKTFEVIGKYVPDKAGYVAEKETDTFEENEKYIRDNNIKYGGVYLTNLLSFNLSKAVSYLTYRGGRIYYPKNKIILTGKEEPSEEELTSITRDRESMPIYKRLEIFAEGHDWKCTPYRIFSKGNGKCCKNAGHDMDNTNTYDALKEIVDNENLWDDNKTNQKINLNNATVSNSVDFLGLNQIIGGANVELLSSNWLAHYMKNCIDDFVGFFGLEDPNQKLLSVEREFKRIDILVKFENEVVIIENKIKSGIERIEAEGCSSQLEKYYNAIEKEFPNKKKHYIILCPDYKKRIIGKELKDILSALSKDKEIGFTVGSLKTYSELKAHLVNNGRTIKDATYYHEFMDFLDNQSNQCQHYQTQKLSERRFLHKILSCQHANESTEP